MRTYPYPLWKMNRKNPILSMRQYAPGYFIDIKNDFLFIRDYLFQL